MFEWIASGFARFTTRRPWLAIIAVIAIAVGLSAMGRPEMSNDNAEFAPDDPAITASERIESLFGSDAAVTPLQFVFVADSPVTSSPPPVSRPPPAWPPPSRPLSSTASDWPTIS